MKREVSNLVSEEVLKAAEAHASSKFKRGAEFHEWSIARDSFIEAKKQNKPVEVSENVKEAARKYANECEDITTFGDWTMVEQAFIAGAKFNHPFEHEAKPEDNNGTGH